MSVDVFQEKIRKTKNPSVVLFEALPELIPQHVLDAAENTAQAYMFYAKALLTALKEIVPGVRFSFGSFAILGPEGLTVLSELLKVAQTQGYYVLLDAPQMLSAMSAGNIASVLGAGENYPCNGIIVPSYLGSDVMKPFAELCAKGKTIYPVVRTSNKTAPEVQDLMTGARLVHTAVADIVSRHAESVIGRCGYSQVGAVAAASAPESLRSLRAKYKRMFLLLDGYDYPNANAKNCSFAFDNLGHGAAACAGYSILGAWKEAETDGTDYVDHAVQAAQRMKKNLTRYITVL